MSRRAAAAPVQYATDQAASSDSELEGTGASRPTKSKQPAKRAAKSKNTSTEQAKEAKVVKPKATRTRKDNGKATTAKTKPSSQPNEEESADEFDLEQSDERAMTTPVGASKTHADVSKPAKAASESGARVPAKRGRKAKEIKTEIPDTQLEESEGDVHATSNFGRTAKVTKQPRPAKRDVIPATQVEESMDVDQKVEEEPKQKQKPRKASPKPLSRKRAGSTSDREDGSDGSTKRHLSSMTKRFEALETRYERLQEVGIKEAEANYDELKKRGEERHKAAENLVSHLRTELAVQSAAAAEAKDLKAKVDELTSLAEKMKSEKEALEASLKAAQAEVKALQVKLVASRAGSEQRVVPGSTTKGANVKGGAGADAQKMAIKEQLYGDLTGLIIRDVKKREDDEGSMDVYDCIQTGKNGSKSRSTALQCSG